MEYAKQQEMKHRRKIILPCVIPWEYGSNKYASQKGTAGFGTIRNATTTIKCSKQLSESNDGVVPWMNCPQLRDKELASQAGLTPFGGIREHAIKVQDKDGEKKKDISKLIGDQTSECILKIWSQANPNAKNGQLFGKHRDAIMEVKGGRQFSQKELNASRAAIPKFHDPRETIAEKAKKADGTRSDGLISNRQENMRSKSARGTENNILDSNYMAWIGGQLTLQSQIQTDGTRKSPDIISKSYFDRVMNEREYLIEKAKKEKAQREEQKEKEKKMDFTVWYLYQSFLFLTAMYFSKSIEFSEKMVNNAEIVNLVNQFRQQDINKADNKQIILDYQNRTTVNDPSDKAQRRFFKHVDPALLKKNMYRKWIALSNEFVPEVGIEEKDTPKKRKAIDDFLAAAFNTSIWRNLFGFLQSKHHPYTRDFQTFYSRIKQLWFEGYSRKSNIISSSGFEHVFMGEHKGSDISGMHSWLRFHLLEQNTSQQFDYHGYIIKRFNFMAAVKFSWRNHTKQAASFFIGTSPEFDLALYTLCFLTRQLNRTCQFEIDGCTFFITSYNFKQRGKNFIGTIYPVAGQFTNKCRHHNIQ
ncbi:Endoribonuclease XendoU family protein [Acanthocheilonema viteae]